MKETGHPYLCPFCSGRGRFVYKMDKFSIYQCDLCKSGGVLPLPPISEIENFYNGFLFRAAIENYPPVFKSAKILYEHLGLKADHSLNMLDIGGGGGFYSKAFEDMGYGKSTYIDLDPEACEFAISELNIQAVINDDVLRLDSKEKFDFIMCRHLIEHLLDPISFLDRIIECIAPGGTLLLMFPNGQSVEYLAYHDKGLSRRINQIKKGQNSSTSTILKYFLTGKILHGMDPPRHLWAISRAGIEHCLKARNVHSEISTYPLTDPAYSPYFVPQKAYEKVQAIFGNMVTSRIFGGTHLVVTIKR